MSCPSRDLYCFMPFKLWLYYGFKWQKYSPGSQLLNCLGLESYSDVWALPSHLNHPCMTWGSQGYGHCKTIPLGVCLLSQALKYLQGSGLVAPCCSGACWHLSKSVFLHISSSARDTQSLGLLKLCLCKLFNQTSWLPNTEWVREN